MKKLETKPFALIGVNTNNHDPGQLKEIMDREKMPWRSFADRGTINAQWNQPATPMYYVLDHQGTIRHKWVGAVGEKAMDAALEKLIQEVERLGKSK